MIRYATFTLATLFFLTTVALVWTPSPVLGYNSPSALQIISENCRRSDRATDRLFRLVSRQAKKGGVRPAILAAVVVLESTCRPLAINVNKNGSTDVGLAQINVRDNDPVEISRLLQPAYNLRASAKILSKSRKWCIEHPNSRFCACPHGLYNPHRAKRWCGKLLAILSSDDQLIN